MITVFECRYLTDIIGGTICNCLVATKSKIDGKIDLKWTSTTEHSLWIMDTTCKEWCCYSQVSYRYGIEYYFDDVSSVDGPHIKCV